MPLWYKHFFMTIIPQIIIGLLLLVLGRRLFWIFVGALGFVAGLQLAQLYFGLQPVWMVWLIALLGGIFGTLLAVFFQTLALGLAGFAAGSTIAAYFANLTGCTSVLIIAFIGGIVGLILLYTIFDWALIGLSSIVGSTLLIQAWPISSGVRPILLTTLIAVGFVIQAAQLVKQRPHPG
jgi:hypothetical protein